MTTNAPYSELPTSTEAGTTQHVLKDIEMFQEQLRTLKDHLEASAKLHVGMGHALIPWLLQWTGATLNRYVVHKNGMTSHQRTTGKKSTRPVATFGEKVLYMPLKTKRLKTGKDEPKLKEGLWLGV